MYKGIYKFAGHIIEIFSLYVKVHRRCTNYRWEGTPEFSVKTNEADIFVERQKTAEADRQEGRIARDYSNDYLETLAVYRKIVEVLIEKNIVLCHGSVIAVDGEGYLFTAKSGTGKSTHTRLWMEEFKERGVVVNDDKPLLEVTNAGIMVYGTPWDGKHRLSSNIVVPLKAVCVINRNEKNYVEIVDKKRIYPMLLQQIYRPYDSTRLSKTLKLMGQIMERAELYNIYCNMEPEAARIVYGGINGER